MTSLFTPPAPVALPGRARHRGLLGRARSALEDEAGAATAEYAIATLAAVGLAGLLVVVLRGDDVKGMLVDLIHRALSAGG
ncbi:DUF4244 domain-containing protein [Herbiconiux sp.]|uniref:DUF4244 domain-containing protein n=1 Tax=Herbiconiux sp. TaxID=1871186 RepID=UPI0025BE8013|nr:DUF4244 domain-containing protein [Herbiconiux sp.]